VSKDNFIFKRVEKKYLLSDGEREALLEKISPMLVPDQYGHSTISSLYLDTPDFRIIRASIEAKLWGHAYKEKLRLRTYGLPTEQSKAFLEIKKKYKGVVYKRRISLRLSDAVEYINGGEKPPDSQIMREIDYAMRFYGQPKPSVMVSYERDAFFVRDLPALRITFDSNVRFRDTDLDLTHGSYGKKILADGYSLMEIKTDGAMPLWLSRVLDGLGIYPTSFSKYGKAYLDIMNEMRKKENE
jgi:SPX domain protein involved in polyphosphate accumulation